MGVSRRAGDFILQVVSLLLRTAMKDKSEDLNTRQEQTMKQIPLSIQTALSRYNLDGRVVIYAVCPACHCIYKPEYKPGSTIAIYPIKCTNVTNPQSDPCGEALTRAQDTGEPEPIKRFIYYDFMDYLAGLLALPEAEQLMDDVCDEAFKSRDDPPPKVVTSIFQGTFIKNFEGPDSTPDQKRYYIDRRGEGRYFFTENIDFFHPEGQSIRSASTSCGIISLSPISLGLDWCYRPEYMYIAGIITGPLEPHGVELNHYQRPIVDAMEIAWHRGIRFSRTALHPEGRNTRSAIVLLACDFPAARKAAQMSSTGGHWFCSVCMCYHKNNYGRTDCHAWKRKDVSLLRKYAFAWRDAATVKDRDIIFQQHGVRCSELWRLVYWDPTRQLIVDSMHCILERVVQHHVRNALLLTTEAATAKVASTPAFSHQFSRPGDDEHTGMTEKEVKQIDKVHRLLVASVTPEGDDEDSNPEKNENLYWEEAMDVLENKLNKTVNAKPLAYVCKDLGCLPSARRVYKLNYVKALVNWVSEM